MNPYHARKDFTAYWERIKLGLAQLERIPVLNYSQREETVPSVQVDSFATLWQC